MAYAFVILPPGSTAASPGASQRVAYKGWIIVDDHYAPLGPRQDFARTRKYIREKLLPIYS